MHDNQDSVRKRTLRSILKDATASQHAQLDDKLAAFNLQDVHGYCRFLEANAAALLPLEGALVAAGVQDTLVDWERHARTNAMLSDLQKIGGAQLKLDPPTLDSRFAVLGTLYVLEGSRLGSAYLLKHVRSGADPRILGATAYLAHGSGQHLWNDFLDVLESHAATLVNEMDIVLPARRAFELFAKAAALR